jgi:phosphotransferase system  glucose/maltose/N-acetylglucosamine-specific IIC component
LIAMLFFPIWQKVDTVNREKITLSAIKLTHDRENITSKELEIVNESSTYPIAILAFLAAAVAIYSIFKYENRLTQMKLGALNSLLISACLGITVYFIFEAKDVFTSPVQPVYLPAFYFTAAALFFNLLANRFIRRDERLVRSADRIR